ncbi:DNA mismatch repair endonuclease MutL [Putridiphycobacter roseus]|uniref:DNA mismatch repair protein MutL n=1 Tax=Putridiphycobacter roseus TaxID=2219161 RepID=A0A2W1N1B9_9FLAO|nr:DNA mismatch repair endonuclease MutL [Putridiphycobacter roseus]PZE18037.1 DNA mismatch repair endonuclease MutL [Putridiphycobacter roseus]
MSDLIKLLPNHIANQIAAGEVVQRPASAVKELIENSIDAGATAIDLIVKDGGKTLIQVIDNGCGMSENDARMSFERHATSKIATADDLFHLQTKGFRGEALASVAAIAHVELKTKLHAEELGTQICVEGSKIKSQEPVQANNGTSISVKNLFYNIPARRNFLGSNITEYKHVLNEFLRVALVHPEVHFTFHNNGDEIYNLPPAGLRQRIVHAFGKNYNSRLVPVQETTDIFSVTGFIVKPEFARSSRDQMYLFVNNRFFKDKYLNHAIQSAFEGMISSKKYPAYFLYFTVPTTSIDVNVHPTKTEIKFENNKEIYAILRSAVKQAIGQYNISPSIDFDLEQTFDTPSPKLGEIVAAPTVKVDPNFNPFNTTAKPSSGGGSSFQGGQNSAVQPNPSDWESYYHNIKNTSESESEESPVLENILIPSKIDNEFQSTTKAPYQIHTKYILTTIKNGFILIDQFRAHARILYNQLLQDWESSTRKTQQLLFPEEFEISASDFVFLHEISEDLTTIGFDFEWVDGKKMLIKGAPAELSGYNLKGIIEDIAAAYKSSEQKNDISITDLVLKSIASSSAIKGGTKLGLEQMQHIVDELFACENYLVSPHGKPVMITYNLEDIQKKFN